MRYYYYFVYKERYDTTRSIYQFILHNCNHLLLSKSNYSIGSLADTFNKENDVPLMYVNSLS